MKASEIVRGEHAGVPETGRHLVNVLQKSAPVNESEHRFQLVLFNQRPDPWSLSPSGDLAIFFPYSVPDFVLDQLLLLVYSSSWIFVRLNPVAPASCRRFCFLSCTGTLACAFSAARP